MKRSRSIAGYYDVGSLLLGRELVILIDIVTWLLLPLYPLFWLYFKREARQRRKRYERYYSGPMNPEGNSECVD